MSSQSTSDFGPDLVEVFGPSQRDGGPELVQLLTPEGERVEHPEFRFEPEGGADEAETIRKKFVDAGESVPSGVLTFFSSS